MSFFLKWQGSWKTTGNRMENEIKELESMKANKYLGVEDSHNIDHKIEKD